MSTGQRASAAPGQGGAALRLSLPNDRTAIEEARQAVLAFLAPSAPTARTVYRVELILEEVLMNVIWHAFPDAAVHLIELTVSNQGDAIVMQFEDEGQAFDPLRAERRPAPSDIGQAVPGGFGLQLVRGMAETLEYERIAQRNRLTVRVALG